MTKYVIMFAVYGADGYRYRQPLVDDARRPILFDSPADARAGLEASADAWEAQRSWTASRRAAYVGNASVEETRNAYWLAGAQ